MEKLIKKSLKIAMHEFPMVSQAPQTTLVSRVGSLILNYLFRFRLVPFVLLSTNNQLMIKKYNESR